MSLQTIIAVILATLIVSSVIILEEITFSFSEVLQVKFGDNVVYCLPVVFISCMVIQFCTFLAIIKQRYTWLNKQIEDIALLCKNQILHVRKNRLQFCNEQYSVRYRFSNENFIENIVSAIKVIKQKHKRLDSISLSLNAVYSVQILTSVIDILFTFLATIFFWAHKQLQEDWGNDIKCQETYMYFAVGLLLIHAAQLTFLAVFCSKTVKEVRTAQSVKNIHIFLLGK